MDNQQTGTIRATAKTGIAGKGNRRWFIVAWFFLILLVVYIDRVNLAMAAPLILRDFQLSPSQLGLAMSGFTIGYTILLFPGGSWLHTFPPGIASPLFWSCVPS